MLCIDNCQIQGSCCIFSSVDCVFLFITSYLPTAVLMKMSLDTTTSPSEEARENHFGFLEKQLEQATSEQFDIFQQLSKKERDLELAAELGKVLLQENEELKHRIEVVTQDYHDKLEVIFNFVNLRFCQLRVLSVVP